MKPIILLLYLIVFVLGVTEVRGYKHKSEAEIAAMTAAERVDEWVNEQVHHRFDVLDKQGQLIEKYILPDGINAIPRIIEILNKYDPTSNSGKRGRMGEQFDGAWMLLSDIDNHVIRLRSTEEGRRAIEALEQAIERMRKAGYGQPEQDDWTRHGRFESVADRLRFSNGINFKDQDIRDTLRFVYKINMSDAELSEYSQYMTAHYPDYPGWSEGKLTKDESKLGAGGYPVQIILMRKPERYYKAYLEFKNQRINR